MAEIRKVGTEGIPRFIIEGNYRNNIPEIVLSKFHYFEFIQQIVSIFD